MSPVSESNPNSAARTPSFRAMSLMSVALFVHLFLVLAALSANLRPWNSQVQANLIDRFAPYLTTLGLDPDYRRFHLTHGTPLEDNHIVRVQLLDPETGEVAATAELPGGGNRFLPDHHRHLRLTRRLGALAESEDDAAAAALAKSIGGHFLGDDGRRALILCRRVESQPMRLSELTPGFPHDPGDEQYEQPSYAADVIRAADGQLLVGKTSSRRESAGAVPDAGESGGEQR